MHRMKTSWTVLLISLIGACEHKSEQETIKTTTQYFSDVVMEDEMPPPMGDPVSHTTSIDQWLKGICQERGPKEPVTKYELGLFESSTENILCLVGRNMQQTADTSFDRIVFKPKDLYFKLPQADYKNMDRAAFLNKLYAELVAFTETEAFKKSYLSKAQSLVFNANGKNIWSK